MNHHSQRPLVAALALVLAGLGACGKTVDGAATNPPVSAAPANVSDGDITEHVTKALSQAESLKGLDIKVATTQGDVRLTGMVDNQMQIDDAMRIARAAEGSHTIHDELTIRK
jgi:hyperosmotically inducible periplasmic protein